MRIAQVAPLVESVPPQLYGGTERVVSFLTEALVAAGHEVTLFASGDSKTSARLVPVVPRALRLDPDEADPLMAHVLENEEVFEAAGEFDVVHFHVDYLHYPLARRVPITMLTTLHGRLDLPGLRRFYGMFPEMPVVSISDSQRTPLPGANWIGTVYNGEPDDLLHFHPRAGDYLAFLGRISPEKQPDQAIAIAKQAGLPLRIAAKVDPVDQEYFDQKIKPLLDHPLIDWVGEVGDEDKEAFLGNAAALLFPIGWPEPFGLVMIEALACGTPTIAYRRGSVPEILVDGETGFICEGIEDAVQAVGRIPEISRERCRQEFDARFTARRMAEEYVTLYEQQRRGANIPPLAPAPPNASAETF